MDNCMLCETITEQEALKLDRNRWKCNKKEDGERILAIKDGKEVKLMNRRGREKSFIYSEIVRELKRSDESFIIDGEIITDDYLFNSLQHRSNLSDRFKIKEAEKKYPVKFMVFDILEVNGKRITDLPLKERLKFWEHISFKIIKPIDIRVMLVEYGDIKEMLDRAKNNNYEGIIIKDMESRYEFRRSKSWLKLKLWKEVIIEFGIYEQNPAGIKLSDGFYEVQVQNNGSDRVERIKQKIDMGEKIKVEIQYLTQNERTKKLRFPSCRKVYI